MKNFNRLKRSLKFVVRKSAGCAIKPNPIFGSALLALALGLAPQFEVHAAGLAVQSGDAGAFAFVLSTNVLLILGLGLLVILVLWRLRSRNSREGVQSILHGVGDLPNEAVQGSQSPPQSRDSDKKSQTSQTQSLTNRRAGDQLAVATPDSLFGAYRIDQEVGKLVLGHPHRVDVLSSRAPEDRRAIKTSLIKIIGSNPDDSERRRAAEALEEYGFVARECATLLMAADPYDRSTAARSLGEIKSLAALPFLLEGLYDSEPIVRHQAVASIGELKVPRAIGPLLDMARRHPDVPGNLINKALSACSVEGLALFDTTIPRPATVDARSEGFGYDISKLEPAAAVEDLPPGSTDPELAESLSGIQSRDVGKRFDSAKNLARYQVGSAVSALTSLARLDADSSVRAQAISSLAWINHESVFPAVLMGMTDESREVRAAAARSLNHLSFDRTDAYIRVLEKNDEELLHDVAKACIQTGIVSQGIDRLASGDRRQAYETFSIISLLAKAKLTEPVFDVVINHSNLGIRLAALQLLTNTGDAEVFEQLRELALREGIVEEVQTAMLEALYKFEQSNAEAQPEAEPALSASTSESPFEPNAEAKEGLDVETVPAPEPQTQADDYEL